MRPKPPWSRSTQPSCGPCGLADDVRSLSLSLTLSSRSDRPRQTPDKGISAISADSAPAGAMGMFCAAHRRCLSRALHPTAIRHFSRFCRMPSCTRRRVVELAAFDPPTHTDVVAKASSAGLVGSYRRPPGGSRRLGARSDIRSTLGSESCLLLPGSRNDPLFTEPARLHLVRLVLFSSTRRNQPLPGGCVGRSIERILRGSALLWLPLVGRNLAVEPHLNGIEKQKEECELSDIVEIAKGI